MAGVDELVVLVDADQECAKVFPAGAGSGKATNDDLLLQNGLDLEPGAATHPRQIGAVAKLCDDPFEPFLLCRLEKIRALAEDMVRVLEQPGVAHDVTEQSLAVFERHLEQALAVEIDDVEDDVLHRVRFFPAVLQ